MATRGYVNFAVAYQRRFAPGNELRVKPLPHQGQFTERGYFGVEISLPIASSVSITVAHKTVNSACYE